MVIVWRERESVCVYMAMREMSGAGGCVTSTASPAIPVVRVGNLTQMRSLSWEPISRRSEEMADAREREQHGPRVPSLLQGCAELMAPQNGRTALVSALECDAKGERIAAAGVQKIVRVFDVRSLVDEHCEMDDEGNLESQKRDVRRGGETGTTSTSTSMTTTLSAQFTNPAKVSALAWGGNDAVLGCGTCFDYSALNYNSLPIPSITENISATRRVTRARAYVSRNGVIGDMKTESPTEREKKMEREGVRSTLISEIMLVVCCVCIYTCVCVCVCVISDDACTQPTMMVFFRGMTSRRAHCCQRAMDTVGDACGAYDTDRKRRNMLLQAKMGLYASGKRKRVHHARRCACRHNKRDCSDRAYAVRTSSGAMCRSLPWR